MLDNTAQHDVLNATIAVTHLGSQACPVADDGHATPCGTQESTGHNAISNAPLASADSLEAYVGSGSEVLLTRLITTGTGWRAHMLKTYLLLLPLYSSTSGINACMWDQASWHGATNACIQTRDCLCTRHLLRVRLVNIPVTHLHQWQRPGCFRPASCRRACLSSS